MVSDKKINRAFRTHTNLNKQNPLIINKKKVIFTNYKNYTLALKYYVHCCKFSSNPLTVELRAHLKYFKDKEYFISKKNGKLPLHFKKQRFDTVVFLPPRERSGGTVFIHVCLCVCLFVSALTFEWFHFSSPNFQRIFI